MIAEVLLVLAGHSSSLFPTDHNVHPAFRPLLHPGEEQCLEALGRIAFRYRNIKKACTILSRSKSRYVCALCATLNQILKDEYEKLVVDTEAKVLKRDPELVAHRSFVPLSAVRATFAEWDSPLTALETLMDQLQAEKYWQPGPLIDMLLARAETGVHRIADIISRLSVAVQRVWRANCPPSWYTDPLLLLILWHQKILRFWKEPCPLVSLLKRENPSFMWDGHRDHKSQEVAESVTARAGA